LDSEQTTTAQGNAFRDDVAALLRAAHLEDVETEVRVRHKKVDITFFETTLTQRRRVAVECKDYDRPLTKAQIKEEIYSDYWPLIDEDEIDGLLIVGRVAPNADARSYIDSIRGFQFKTYMELQNGLMNFGSYLQAMRAQFQEQGLNQYYVKPRLEDGGDLEERILRWLGESSSRPVAILAGYGMGKTSFARRAASLVALEHSRSPDTRIPILIRLGEIANEQGLEGLLGKVFTATNVVRNYHFELFMELNRAGRFFIILDGFDEMKHTMSWAHFKYNFGELNRLVVL
jgi:predicted NACHT family NTPase